MKKHNILIVGRKNRITRRIAHEVIKSGNDVRIINPKHIIGYSTHNNTFEVSTNEDDKPIKIEARGISGLIAYCRHPIVEFLGKGLGIKTMNSYDSIKTAANKYSTSVLLNKMGLPVAKETIITSNSINKDSIFENLGFPLILKTFGGSQGKGVYLADDLDLANDISESIINKYGKVIAQSFVDTKDADTTPKDYRVFYCYGSIVATMERRATTGIKTNNSIHKNSVAYDATPAMKSLSIQASSLLGLGVAGVDVAFNVKTGEYVIYEVNSCPGLIGIESVTGINVAEKIASGIISKSVPKSYKFPSTIKSPRTVEFSRDFNGWDNEDLIDMSFQHKFEEINISDNKMNKIGLGSITERAVKLQSKNKARSKNWS